MTRNEFDRYLFGVPRLVRWLEVGYTDPDAYEQYAQRVIEYALNPKLDRTQAKAISGQLTSLTLIWHRDKGMAGDAQHYPSRGLADTSREDKDATH